MANIYAFGPDWSVPPQLETKLSAIMSKLPSSSHTHTTGQVDGLEARLNQLGVDVSTAGAVKSVNGQTGNVVVDPTNILNVDGYFRYRGELPAGTDLNTLRNKEHSGIWDMPASSNYANSPIDGTMRAILLVFAFGPGPAIHRVSQFSIASSFERTAISFSLWSPWGSASVANLPAGSDIDSLRTSTDWVIRGTADAQSMLGAWPEGVGRSVAHIQVRATSNGLAFQQMQTYGADPQFLIRSSASTAGGPNFAWSTWKNLTKPPAPAQVATEDHSALANTLLLQDFTRRRPVVKTGGKPAVALRYDHGLGNFRDKIVPTLKRLGLPAAICLNAGDWDRAENGGVTASQVNAWVAEGWLEIWNHSLNHTVPPVDPAALETQIKGGLDKLRADLPAATIDGYMPPGGPNDQTGFEGGKTIEAWWKTAPGRAILKHHAVTSGYLPGTVYRTLDGEVRQGLTHYGVDSADLATMKSRVTEAYTPVRGVNIMFHPSLIDTAGYATSADYTAFLEWLAGERDAGRVQVMGCYDLLRADARTTS